MKKTIIAILVFVSGLTGSLLVNAQNDMIIQGMRIIPQSYYSNPAFIPQCRLHIGMPVLSSFYMGTGHNGFNAKNVISVNALDSVEIDVESMLNSMKKHNYVFLEANEELLSFGFKFKDKHYVNFSATERAFARASYPKDLIEFAVYGNGAMLDETLDIGNFRITENHYREFAFGYSYIYDDVWTFGARAKILFGMSNANTRRSDITLQTEGEFFDITATSDLLVNTNEIENMTDTTEGQEFDPEVYMKLTSNMGLGFDMGATYKFDDKITFGLSILDLGYISWKSNPMNIVSKNPGGSFTYDGVDISEFMEMGADSFLQNLQDTLIGIFEVDTTYEKYKTSLNTRIHASAFYKVTKHDYISALIRLHFFDKTVHPSFNLAYMRKFGDIWHLTGSYSIVNRNYTNFGIGMSLKFGPFQMYVLTDNIFGPLLWNKYKWIEENDQGGGLITYEEKAQSIPRNWKYMNFHFGMNFLFGCKPPKDLVPIFE